MLQLNGASSAFSTPFLKIPKHQPQRSALQPWNRQTVFMYTPPPDPAPARTPPLPARPALSSPAATNHMGLWRCQWTQMH